MCVHLCGHMYAENHFGQSILFFYHVSPKGQTQVPRLGSKCTYVLSYLSSPINIILFIMLMMFLSNVYVTWIRELLQCSLYSLAVS